MNGETPERPEYPGQIEKPPGGSRSRMIVAIILLLLPLIYFFPAVIGRRILTIGDGWSYSLPVRIFIGRMLAQGSFPLWNPHIFAGTPFLASIQPGALYPPNWLFAFLPPIAAINTVVILTYHFALIGTYLYGRRIGLGRAPALAAGVAFAFGGFLISHLDQVNYVAALVWLPWVLYALEKIHQSNSPREHWSAVCSGAMIVAVHLFAGLPQASFQIAIVTGLYFFFTFLFRCEGKNRRRFLFGTLWMGLCGTLLSLAQLLPAMELQRQGERFVISYEYFSMMSMPARRLLSLVFPYFFGGGYGPLYQVGGWDHWWLVKWSFAYMGMIGLTLAAVSLTEIRRNKIVCFWSLTAVVSLFLCFGSYLPFELNRLLYRIPVYHLFRGSYRHLFELNFALAVLAGFGMEALSRADLAARRAFRFSAIALTALVAATIVAYRFFEDRFRAESPPPANGAWLTNPEAMVPIIFFLLSIPVTWIVSRRTTPWRSALLIMVLMFDLASFGWYSHWRIVETSVYNRLSDSPVVQAIKARETDLNSFRVLSYTESSIGTDLEALNHQNLSIIRGLQSVNGYDPMRISRFAPLAGGMDISGNATDQKTLGMEDRGLDLLNVKYLIFERKGPLDPHPESGVALSKERWRSLASFGFITLYENKTMMPKAWIANDRLALSEDEILRVIKEGKFGDGRLFKPQDTTLIESTHSTNQILSSIPNSQAQPSQVTIEHYEPQMIQLRARCPQPGYLVLSEIYYPGWEAYVNDVQTPIERVHYALRGLRLAPGDHQVKFIFRPKSFQRGLMASTLGAVILLIGAVISRRPMRG